MVGVVVGGGWWVWVGVGVGGVVGWGGVVGGWVG